MKAILGVLMQLIGIGCIFVLSGITSSQLSSGWLIGCLVVGVIFIFTGTLTISAHYKQKKAEDEVAAIFNNDRGVELEPYHTCTEEEVVLIEEMMHELKEKGEIE